MSRCVVVVVIELRWLCLQQWCFLVPLPPFLLLPPDAQDQVPHKQAKHANLQLRLPVLRHAELDVSARELLRASEVQRGALGEQAHCAAAGWRRGQCHRQLEGQHQRWREEVIHPLGAVCLCLCFVDVPIRRIISAPSFFFIYVCRILKVQHVSMCCSCCD